MRQISKFLYILLAGLLVWQTWRLPTPPDEELMVAMALSLIALGAYILGLQQRLIRNVVGYTCFSLALIIVVIALKPSGKNMVQAVSETAAKTEAGQIGYKLAQQVANSEISKEVAQEKLNAVVLYKEVAETALQFGLENKDDNANNLITQAAKLIDLKYKEWNCNNFGCAYTDNAFVWTIGANNLLAGRIVSILIIATLIALVVGTRVQLTATLQKVFGKQTVIS